MHHVKSAPFALLWVSDNQSWDEILAHSQNREGREFSAVRIAAVLNAAAMAIETIS